MNEIGVTDFQYFLDQVNSSEHVLNRFITVVTIHTTYWFREEVHFKSLEISLNDQILKGKKSFSVWSSACSTGQEVYSIALVFEKLKKQNPEIVYNIIGTDIDKNSIEKANAAIFHSKDLSSIPSEYHQFILLGEGKLAGFFTLNKTIRANCRFLKLNLDQASYSNIPFNLDYIFCRNVLIYFNSKQVIHIVKKASQHLVQNGKLFLGLTEPLLQNVFGLLPLKNSIFEKSSKDDKKLIENGKEIKILIIDDVEVIRNILKTGFSKPGFICYVAGTASEASIVIKNHKIDFITLDLNLPDQNGADWLRSLHIAGFKIPTVVISGSNPDEAQSIYGALNIGAIEFIEKKNLVKNIKHLEQLVLEVVRHDLPRELNNFVSAKNAQHNPQEVNPVLQERLKKVSLIVIAASTGGPSAIWEILKNKPKPSPPIVIIQHNSVFFAKEFAKTVAEVSGLIFGSNEDYTILSENHFYLATDDYHIQIEKKADQLILLRNFSQAQNSFRPSADILLNSVALLNVSIIAIILTGLGADGALGMKSLFDSGWAYTMAQSKDSCIVFGMPAAAIEKKCIHDVKDIKAIQHQINKLTSNFKN